MKRSICMTVVLVFLILPVVALSSYGKTPIEDEALVEELVRLAKEAECLTEMISGENYLNYCFETREQAEQSVHNNGSRYLEIWNWGKAHGYLSGNRDSVETCELEIYDRHTGEKVTVLHCFAFPTTVGSQKILEDLKTYFSRDIYDFYGCNHSLNSEEYKMPCYTKYLVEKDGRMYRWCEGSYNQVPSFTEEEWSSGRLLERAESKAVLGFDSEGIQQEHPLTVIFEKTSVGWRISGGTYFETVDDITPPETGDNTPIFLTLTALSVFGLVALAVTVGRKKKERL